MNTEDIERSHRTLITNNHKENVKFPEKRHPENLN